MVIKEKVYGVSNKFNIINNMRKLFGISHSIGQQDKSNSANYNYNNNDYLVYCECFAVRSENKQKRRGMDDKRVSERTYRQT